ncbi:MFS transporter [Aquisalibacillus elongatus]|uniref:DHA2 family metal-tetracycline-proton antiporter-like MFS transporter n=1 Tax=Aquisalibacillus elongatus TaxID=485577 RepID=A0A3N5C748_9BACI|nr:MFS transporter [Aquisalibacillus elongatus]RPF52271.1 DHA2 family metal-tetracycline-proton antiporter-like MFS transporter [Aquisalibacillus elongatus]
MNSGKTYDIQNPKALLFSLCFVLMFAVMNGTMFNIAIPDIAESFNLLPSQVSWVMTGYIMVFAIGALIYGKLTDTIALKTLITFGLCVFSIGSLVGFMAPNYTTVLIARLIQAVGGAMIPAIAFIAPIRYFPNERGKILGIISSVMAFASGIGPIMGGVIGGFLNWQFLFLTSSLIIITLPLLRANLPQEETNFVKLDYLGAGLVAGFIVSLLIGITLSYPISFIFSVVFLILVVIRMKTAKNPFIPPKLFMNQSYVITIMVSFLAISCLFGLMFSVPIMLRDVYGLTTLQIGLTMFPGAMSAALIGRKGGQLVDQKGSRTVLLWSMLLLMTGFFIVSTTVGLDPIWMSLSLIFPMMCFPLVQSSGADTLASILKDRETGVGMGVFNLLIFVSGAISGAVVGITLDVFRPQVPANPIGILGEGAVFSNIFLVFMGLIFIGFLIFKTLFKTYVVKAES